MSYSEKDIRELVDAGTRAMARLQELSRMFNQVNYTDRHGDAGLCRRLADRIESALIPFGERPTP